MGTTKHKKTKRQAKKVDKTLVVLYFIQQKVWEIVAVMLSFLLLYIIGKWDPLKLKLFEGPPTGFWECAAAGGVYTILAFIFVMLIAMLVVLIIQFWNANWAWAERRAKKRAKR